MKIATYFLLVGVLISMVADETVACLNTSYSRAEEKQLTGDLTKILSGQLAEHGEDFYRNQLLNLKEKLRENPYDVELHNDLGAAEIKLKNYDAALKRFQLIEELEPGRYKTAANLGVLFKKMGDYQSGAEFTEKALAIRPEGHLGLGDYYRRMLEWRAARKSGIVEIELTNFLGTPYSAGPQAVAADPVTNMEYLVTLIKADRHFEDTYIVIGDLLFVEGDLQNAVRAYSKAGTMVEPDDLRAEVIAGRIAAVERQWMDETLKDSRRKYDPSFERQLARERRQAEAWVKAFQRVESQMIASGREEVNIKTVKQEMHEQRIAKPRYIEVGHFEVERSGWAIFGYTIVTLVAVVGVAIVGRTMWEIGRAIRR